MTAVTLIMIVMQYVPRRTQKQWRVLRINRVCVLSPVLKEMWLIYYTDLTEKIVGNILLVVRHLSPAPSRGELENKELS